MTDHLADARACIQSAAQAPHPETRISWLTATCEHILDHLEAKNMPQEATVPQPERIDLMTDPKLHELLDQTKSGDQLILAHRIGKHTTQISGPVLTDQTHDPSVGIDLLDGDPHIVRTPTGVVWAPVVQAALYRGSEPIAKWDAAADHLEAQQAPQQPASAPQPETDPACRERWPECRQGGYDPACCRFPKSCSCDAPQPATAPPTAQQDDSEHRDGGEAVQAAMAVLCDMGADSGGWHSWRCFDRELYPEPCDCTKQAARAAIAAAEPHIRAEIADEIEQHYLGADFGRNPTTGADSPDASLHDAYDEALNLAARIARQEQP